MAQTLEDMDDTLIECPPLADLPALETRGPRLAAITRFGDRVSRELCHAVMSLAANRMRLCRACELEAIAAAIVGDEFVRG